MSLWGNCKPIIYQELFYIQNTFRDLKFNLILHLCFQGTWKNTISSPMIGHLNICFCDPKPTIHFTSRGYTPNSGMLPCTKGLHKTTEFLDNYISMVKLCKYLGAFIWLQLIKHQSTSKIIAIRFEKHRVLCI